jgi:hypothetical protein
VAGIKSNSCHPLSAFKFSCLFFKNRFTANRSDVIINEEAGLPSVACLMKILYLKRRKALRRKRYEVHLNDPTQSEQFA